MYLLGFSTLFFGLIVFGLTIFKDLPAVIRAVGIGTAVAGLVIVLMTFFEM